MRFLKLPKRFARKPETSLPRNGAQQVVVLIPVEFDKSYPQPEVSGLLTVLGVALPVITMTGGWENWRENVACGVFEATGLKVTCEDKVRPVSTADGQLRLIAQTSAVQAEDVNPSGWTWGTIVRHGQTGKIVRAEEREAAEYWLEQQLPWGMDYSVDAHGQPAYYMTA